jgi:hypothetical protein
MKQTSNAVDKRKSIIITEPDCRTTIRINEDGVICLTQKWSFEQRTNEITLTRADIEKLNSLLA